jgi:hypothetical protein
MGYRKKVSLDDLSWVKVIDCLFGHITNICTLS